MKSASFYLVLSSCLVGLLVAGSACGESVLFRFDNRDVAGGEPGEFDNNAPTYTQNSPNPGTTMTRPLPEDGSTANPITIRSIDAGVPMYVDDTTPWDGVSYLSVGTDIHTGNGIRLLNPGPFPASGAGSDNAGFNVGEYWVMNFESPVVVDFIDFSSLSQGSEIGRVTLGNMTPIQFDYDTLGTGSANTFNDPFNGAVVPAGTNIKFEGVAGDWRLTQIQVTEVPRWTLSIDRISGAMTLENTSGGDDTLLGYEIDSSIGALKPTGWNTISGHFDDSSNGGNESVDDDDAWTALTDTGASYSNDLTEFAFGGPGGAGNGATLTDGQMVALGQGWFPTLFEDDLTMTIVNSDGSNYNAAVEFTGNGGNPLKRSDFDHDGTVDIDDWNTFNSNRPSDLSGFPLAQAYLRGDLNGDGNNDGNDFLLFVHDYELDNGGGSFAQMLHAVPEPASLILFAACRTRPRRLSQASVPSLPAAAGAGVPDDGIERASCYARLVPAGGRRSRAVQWRQPAGNGDLELGRDLRPHDALPATNSGWATILAAVLEHRPGNGHPRSDRQSELF